MYIYICIYIYMYNIYIYITFLQYSFCDREISVRKRVTRQDIR